MGTLLIEIIGYSLPNYFQVYTVMRNKTVKVSVSEDCQEEVKLNAEYLEKKVNSGLVIYGVNTGFGGSADVRSDQTLVVQQALVRHLNAGKLLLHSNSQSLSQS